MSMWPSTRAAALRHRMPRRMPTRPTWSTAWCTTAWRTCPVPWRGPPLFALNNATIGHAIALADKGWKQALKDDVHLRNGLNVAQGMVTYAWPVTWVTCIRRPKRCWIDTPAVGRWRRSTAIIPLRQHRRFYRRNPVLRVARVLLPLDGRWVASDHRFTSTDNHRSGLPRGDAEEYAFRVSPIYLRSGCRCPGVQGPKAA